MENNLDETQEHYQQCAALHKKLNALLENEDTRIIASVFMTLLIEMAKRQKDAMEKLNQIICIVEEAKREVR